MNLSVENRQERHVIMLEGEPQKAFLLEAAAYSIGRDDTNAIVLDEPSISRQHALLLRLPGVRINQYIYRLVDGNIDGLASKNGTFVNGKPCSSKALQDGNLITFGKKIKAVYFVLSNNESEYLKTSLDKVEFHSIKTDVVSFKETVVSDILDLSLASSTSQEESSNQSYTHATNSFKKWSQKLISRILSIF